MEGVKPCFSHANGHDLVEIRLEAAVLSLTFSGCAAKERERATKELQEWLKCSPLLTADGGKMKSMMLLLLGFKNLCIYNH